MKSGSNRNYARSLLAVSLCTLMTMTLTQFYTIPTLELETNAIPTSLNIKASAPAALYDRDDPPLLPGDEAPTNHRDPDAYDWSYARTDNDLLQDKNDYGTPISQSNKPPAWIQKLINDKKKMKGIEVIKLNRSSMLPLDYSQGSVIPCPVPCRFRFDKDDRPYTLLKVVGTPWTVLTSNEGPAHSREIDYRLKKHTGYAVNTMNSDIPIIRVSLAGMLDKSTIAEPVPFTAADQATFIVSKCKTDHPSRRVQWVRDINTVFPVAGLARCLRSVNVSLGPTMDDKRNAIRKYKFHLAFENQNYDHMTEKIWDPFKVGVIPVYLGDANAKQWTPRNSFISAHDFANGKALGQYLKQVSKNKTLYNSYHEWRRLPPEPRLVKVFHEAGLYRPEYSLQCRVCMWAARKLNYARENRIDIEKLPADVPLPAHLEVIARQRKRDPK